MCVTFHLTFSINSLEAAATRPGQASSQRIFFRIFYRQISVSWGVCSSSTGSAVQQCSGGGAQDVPKISSFHPLVIAPSVTMQCTTFQQGPGPAVIQMSAWNKSMVLNISPPSKAVYRVCTKYRHLRVILQTSERWLARDSDGDNVSEALIMNQITSIRMR